MFDNIREDWRAHNSQWSRHGFWIMVVYRFGRWRYTIPWRPVRLPFSLLGFMQFIAPTIVFVIGIGLGEALNPVRLACFVLIWFAGALFAWDTWQSGRSITQRGASSASLRHETAR